MTAEPSAHRPRYIEQADADFRLTAIVAEKSRRSLAWFARYSWEVLESTELEWTPYLQAQCDTLQAFFEGWLVANDTKKKTRSTPAMRERADAHWRAHELERVPGELLVQDLLINGWPGSLKSRFAMVVGPAWVWLHDPTFTIGATSGTGDNVSRDSNMHKELVLSRWYRETFAISWKVGVNRAGKVVDSTEEWSNSAGGYRLSKELFSSWQGVHVDYLAIDDPDDAAKVWGDADRLRTRRKVTAIRNRTRHPTRSLWCVVQQHVHPEDTTSHQRKHGEWSPACRSLPATLSLALEFRPARRRTTPWGWTDPRTELGEVAHPERYSEAFLTAERLAYTPAGFEAQYNQNPQVTEGGEIKASHFRFCRIEGDPMPWQRADLWRTRGMSDRPQGCQSRDGDGAEPAAVIRRRKDGTLDVDWLVLSVDAKGGSLKASSSNVGLIVIAGKGNQRFILDDQSRVLGWLDTLDALRAMIQQWGPSKVLIEAKAQGGPALESLRKDMAAGELIGPDGRPILCAFEPVEGGSTTFASRFHAMLPAFTAGMVHVLDGAPWADDYISEHCAVPSGHKDDRVDSTSQCLNHYATHGTALSRLKAMTAMLAMLHTTGPLDGL